MHEEDTCAVELPGVLDAAECRDLVHRPFRRQGGRRYVGVVA